MVTANKEFKNECLNIWDAMRAVTLTTTPPSRAAFEIQSPKIIWIPPHYSSEYTFIIDYRWVLMQIASTGYQIPLISFFFIVFVPIFMYKFVNQ